MHTIILKGGSSTLKAVETAIIRALMIAVTFPKIAGQRNAHSGANALVKGSIFCRRNANHMEVERNGSIEWGGAPAPG